MGVKGCCTLSDLSPIEKEIHFIYSIHYLRHVDQIVQILVKMNAHCGQIGVIVQFHVVAVTKPKLEIVLFKIFLDKHLVHFQILSLAQQNLAKIVLPIAQTGHHGVIVQLLVAQDTEHVTGIAQ